MLDMDIEIKHGIVGSFRWMSHKDKNKLNNR